MDRSSRVKETMLRFYEHMSTGNVEGVEGLFTRQPGLVAIGTDPKECWSSFETIARMFRTQLREVGGKLPIKTGSMTALAEGTVGWTADQVTCQLPDGSSMPARITAVLHQEGPEWRIVQLHCSVGVGNADAVGSDLTTS